MKVSEQPEGSEMITTESTILQRVLAPANPSWSRSMAEAVLALRLPEVERARMEQLATKASDGTLSDDERHEAEAYDRIGVLIELMQSKARLSLQAPGARA
jgi:hypothetical protein